MFSSKIAPSQMLAKHNHFVPQHGHSAQQFLRMGQRSVPGCGKWNLHYLWSAISSFRSLTLFQFAVVTYTTHALNLSSTERDDTILKTTPNVRNNSGDRFDLPRIHFRGYFGYECATPGFFSCGLEKGGGVERGFKKKEVKSALTIIHNFLVS